MDLPQEHVWQHHTLGKGTTDGPHPAPGPSFCAVPLGAPRGWQVTSPGPNSLPTSAAELKSRFPFAQRQERWAATSAALPNPEMLNNENRQRKSRQRPRQAGSALLPGQVPDFAELCKGLRRLQAQPPSKAEHCRTLGTTLVSPVCFTLNNLQLNPDQQTAIALFTTSETQPTDNCGDCLGQSFPNGVLQHISVSAAVGRCVTWT